jgi:hypothetical protein
MNIWDVIFYPPKGERHSPVDTLNYTLRPTEQAHVMHRLGVLGNLETGKWPHTWVKLVNTIFQLTVGDFRVYFGIAGRKMVVCYICRKVSQKARQSDLDRARSNFEEYLNSLGSTL